MTLKIPPPNLPLRGILFLDGAKGMFSQTFVNDEYKITMTKWRASRKHPVEVKFTMDGVGGEYDSVEDLKAAITEQGVRW